MTARGIDFDLHLKQRIGAAIARANFLSISSDSWGPAHRLRIFKRYLAPMYEYGAPLVVAWADSYPSNAIKFKDSLTMIRDLIYWITNSKSSYRVAMNLCGLPSPEVRFRLLRTSFQRILTESPQLNPLKQIMGMPKSRLFVYAFAYALSYDSRWNRFLLQKKIDPTATTRTFTQYLRQEMCSAVLEEANHAHLTSLIPPESRKVAGLIMADISLAAPTSKQSMLLRYRQGGFMFGYRCKCHPDQGFKRGHESCSQLEHPCRLTKAERLQKRMLAARLEHAGYLGQVTNVDILLNNHQLERAIAILSSVKSALSKVYYETKLVEAKLPMTDANEDVTMAGPE